jgi:hypothetical protein
MSTDPGVPPRYDDAETHDLQLLAAARGRPHPDRVQPES